MIREKIIKIATLLLICFLTFLLYRIFIVPKREGVRSLRLSLKNIEFQINRFLGEEVALRGGAMEKEELEKELAKLISRIPSQKDLTRIIDQILIQAGKKLKIDYTRIEPMKPQKEGIYLNIPIEIEFICTYPDLFVYLAQLKEMPEVTVINALDLRRLPAQADKLQVRLILSVFVIPEEEEERVNAIVPEPPAKSPAPNPFKTQARFRETVAAPVPSAAGPDTTAQAAAKPATVLSLEGIVKGDFNAALINDQIIYVGDYIMGYQLLDVRKNFVILEKGGKKLILRQKD